MSRCVDGAYLWPNSCSVDATINFAAMSSAAPTYLSRRTFALSMANGFDKAAPDATETHRQRKRVCAYFDVKLAATADRMRK